MAKGFTPEELSRKTEKELLELQVQIAHETYLNSENIKGNVSFIFRAIALFVVIAAAAAIIAGT